MATIAIIEPSALKSDSFACNIATVTNSFNPNLSSTGLATYHIMNKGVNGWVSVLVFVHIMGSRWVVVNIIQQADF